MPATFAAYVCAVSKRPGRTLVGIEHPARFQETYDKAQLADDPRSVLLSGLGKIWEEPYGAGSKGMLAMATSISSLENADVVAFAGAKIEPPAGVDTQEEFQRWFSALSASERLQANEDFMAETLLAASEEGYSRVVVLVGNLHAHKAPSAFFEGVSHMAMLIPDALSLDWRRDGGTAFNVTSEGPGEHALPPNMRDVPAGSRAPAIGFFESGDSSERGFDGYVYLGTVTASPPAVQPE